MSYIYDCILTTVFQRQLTDIQILSASQREWAEKWAELKRKGKGLGEETSHQYVTE